MIGHIFGHFLDRPFSPIIKGARINPNLLTIAGFSITVIAALVIPVSLILGGLLILLGALFDIFDGIVARVNGKTTKFGAFLDSLLDRYSDAFIFLSIAWYFFERADNTGVFFCIATMVGALLVSYARARAEGLGINCNAGIMERPERIILLIIAMLTGWVKPIMAGMFVLTHLTVIQRSYVVWRAKE